MFNTENRRIWRHEISMKGCQKKIKTSSMSLQSAGHESMDFSYRKIDSNRILGEKLLLIRLVQQ